MGGNNNLIVNFMRADMNESPVSSELKVCGNGEGIKNSGLQLVSNGEADNLEPYEGMEFESEEAARAFYEAYAKRVGFVTRVSSYSRSKLDESIIARRLVCNKEGFKKGNVKRPLAVTREGCKAMINVKRQKPGRWIISKFQQEHTHPLKITSKVHRECHQNRSSEEDARKIRKLSHKLFLANQRCTMYPKHLETILKDVEEHTCHLSNKIQNTVHTISQI